MSGWSLEDAIAMERRHVLEGEKLVARQEALMDRLIGKGNPELVTIGYGVLALLTESLELSRKRLRDLESHPT
jgi:hypothetical protein